MTADCKNLHSGITHNLLKIKKNGCPSNEDHEVLNRDGHFMWRLDSEPSQGNDTRSLLQVSFEYFQSATSNLLRLRLKCAKNHTHCRQSLSIVRNGNYITNLHFMCHFIVPISCALNLYCDWCEQLHSFIMHYVVWVCCCCCCCKVLCVYLFWAYLHYSSLREDCCGYYSRARYSTLHPTDSIISSSLRKYVLHIDDNEHNRTIYSTQ